jgi:hypothetical protein
MLFSKVGEIKARKSLIRLSLAEKILNGWYPEDDMQISRKNCFMYEIREARMRAEADSGKVSSKIIEESAKICAETEKAMIRAEFR